MVVNNKEKLFHIGISPSDGAPLALICGDPGRVCHIAALCEELSPLASNREYTSYSAKIDGKRIIIMSHGIGGPSTAICVEELYMAGVRTIIRIGTCGGLQPYTPVGTFVCSEKSIGFDGLLNFYAGRNSVCDLPMERAFLNHMGWSGNMCAPAPYVIDASTELIDRIAQNDMVRGVTIAAGGFFGPQGRELRVPLADPHQNEKIEKFEYNGYHITNFEMESSALAGLSRLMGHKAMTVCMVIANRLIKEANTGYKNTIDTLIKTVLDRI